MKKFLLSVLITISLSILTVALAQQSQSESPSDAINSSSEQATASLQSGEPPAPAMKGGVPAEFKLVWADEFNTDGPPNPANWVFENGFVRNNELQWYQPDNAWCEDGMLIIEARREQVPNPRYQRGSGDWRRNREVSEFTSTSMQTRGLHSWLYGRFEMRARIVTKPGLWPAFWTLGFARGWPGGGEIDIMEYYRGMILANAAWSGGRGFNARWDDSRTPVEQFGGPDWSDQFHIWWMDWDENKIEIYLDGKLLNDVDLSRTINAGGQSINPFHEPHYMLVNLAIGGMNGGDPAGTEFPSRYEIDYVRVYQK